MDKYTATEEAYKKGRADALEEAMKALKRIALPFERGSAKTGTASMGLCLAMEYIDWMIRREHETK